MIALDLRVSLSQLLSPRLSHPAASGNLQSFLGCLLGLAVDGTAASQLSAEDSATLHAVLQAGVAKKTQHQQAAQRLLAAGVEPWPAVRLWWAAQPPAPEGRAQPPWGGGPLG